MPKITTLWLIVFFSLSTLADDKYLQWVEDNDLSLYPVVATNSQKDPLSSVVDILFSSGIATVGEALDILLMPTGYRLPNPLARDPYMAKLLNQPLPSSFRHIGPVPVYVALDAFAGDEFVLVTDDVHSLVGFDLMPQFRARYGAGAPYSFVPASYTAPANVERVWFIREGERFSQALKRWADAIDWDLRWKIEDSDDMVIEAEYKAEGSFYFVVTEALTNFELHGKKVKYQFVEDAKILYVKPIHNKNKD